MGALARPAPLGLPSWRPIVLLAALVLALAAASAIIVGSQPRLPSPFGPARNGPIFASTPQGAIVTLDPTTGATTPHTGDGAAGLYPWFAADGTRYALVRRDGDNETLFVANADGTGVTPLVTATGGTLDWWDWSPDGDRLIVTTSIEGKQEVWLADANAGTATRLDFGMQLDGPTFRPGGREIVFKGSTPFPNNTWSVYASSVDDPDPRPLIPVTGIDMAGGALSPDGTLYAYPERDGPLADAGDIRVVNVDTLEDGVLQLAGGDVPGEIDIAPVWSPDGTTLLLERWANGARRYVLVRVDGTGEAIELTGGPRVTGNDNPERLFSPDGTMLVMRYPSDNSLWVYDTATGDGTAFADVQLDGLTWQRLAP